LAEFTRRDFLRAGAALAAAAAGTSLVGRFTPQAYASPRTKMPDKWDMEADVVVVGSGTGLTGALAAAVQGSEVIVLEKLGIPGGSTIMSGGWVWIPNNPIMRAEGIHDSRENALTYVRLIAGDQSEDEIIETFVDEGPKMVEFVAANTPIKWGIAQGLFQAAEPCTEYHPEWPGAVPVGRSLCALVDGQPGRGPALIQALLEGARAKGVKFYYNTPARQLIIRENPAGEREVIGLLAEQGGREIFIKARQGVLLTAGGFDCNQEMKKSFLRGPTPYWTGSMGLTGDGILMAMAVGADLRNMNECYGMPVYKEEAERRNAQGQAASLSFLLEKSKPGAIMVNRYGERFCNEASDYDSLWRSFFAWENWGMIGYRNIPAYAIFDGSVREKYTICGVAKDQPLPDWVKQANSLRELAAMMGIDPDGLERTVREFNEFAKNGKDARFHRGESLYDRAWATPLEGIQATLGPIENPPFFAAEIAPGDIGTSGGVRVNKHGQALDVLGRPIPRLYAAGNNSGVGGPGVGYGGGGGTIGPCMTFAYLAGKHAAGLPRW
jgi:3-oxosteroid 1-dehydrogenase